MKVPIVKGEPQLPTNSLHVLEGIHSRTEHKEHWGAWARLLIGDFKGDGPLLNIFGAKLLFNIQTAKIQMWVYSFTGCHMFTLKKNADGICKNIHLVTIIY